jgi:hypothetical protein
MRETKFDNETPGWKRHCAICGCGFERVFGLHVMLFEDGKKRGNLCDECIEAGPKGDCNAWVTLEEIHTEEELIWAECDEALAKAESQGA